MVTDYLSAEVTEREGILKPKIKSDEHVPIMHTHTHTKKELQDHLLFLSRVYHVIKEETGKMQSKPWSHRRCQISHGFQQD